MTALRLDLFLHHLLHNIPFYPVQPHSFSIFGAWAYKHLFVCSILHISMHSSSAKIAFIYFLFLLPSAGPKAGFHSGLGLDSEVRGLFWPRIHIGATKPKNYLKIWSELKFWCQFAVPGNNQNNGNNRNNGNNLNNCSFPQPKFLHTATEWLFRLFLLLDYSHFPHYSDYSYYSHYWIIPIFPSDLGASRGNLGKGKQSNYSDYSHYCHYSDYPHY